MLGVSLIYNSKPDACVRMIVTKVLQATALKCDDLVVETQSAVFQPPRRRINMLEAVASSVNMFIYRSNYQVAFGLQ